MTHTIKTTMKHSIRITACIVALMMVLPLVSCGSASQKDIYELYNSASDATNSLDAYKAISKMNITVTGKDTDIKMSSSTEVSIKGLSASPEYLMVSSSDYNGITYTNTDYFSSGKLYSEADGVKTVREASEEETVSQFVDSFDFSLTEKTFDGAKSKTTDGLNEIQVSPSSDVLGSKLSALPRTAESMVAMDSPQTEVTDSSLNIKIKDGYILSFTATINATVSDEENTYNVTTKLSIDYTSPGQEPKITPPDDLGEYTEQASSDNNTDETDMVPEEAYDAAFALFDAENGYTKVENYDELYTAACNEYGKDVMDALISTIEMITAVSEK